MIRILSLSFAMALVLAACASRPSEIQFLFGAQSGDSDNSVLISRCNLECNELLKSKFVFETPILFPTVAGAIVNAVDGVKGVTTIKCELCEHTATAIYNDPERYRFELHLPPGEHLLNLSKNHLQSTFSENIPVSIVTKPGHIYFIGNITKTFEGYTWSPVVVDLTEMVVVYPHVSPW